MAKLITCKLITCNTVNILKHFQFGLLTQFLISLTWPDSLHAGTYQLEIVSATYNL